MDKSWSVGNACEDEQMYVVVNGNLNTNNHKLQLVNAHVLVYGIVDNWNNVTIDCENSNLIEIY